MGILFSVQKLFFFSLFLFVRLSQAIGIYEHLINVQKLSFSFFFIFFSVRFYQAIVFSGHFWVFRRFFFPFIFPTLSHLGKMIIDYPKIQLIFLLGKCIMLIVLAIHQILLQGCSLHFNKLHVKTLDMILVFIKYDEV